MSQRTDSGFKTFEADEAITLYSRVKFDADGKITNAGLADRCIGTLQTTPATAAGDKVSVKLRNADGTHKVRVKEAVTRGSSGYSEAAGEVQDTWEETSVFEGTFLETATAEDDVVEFLFHDQSNNYTYIPNAAQQALSGAGAATVTEYYTAWTTTSTDALTLADGTKIGQLKRIQLIVDGGTGTLTPTNLNGGTTITFADAGDYVILLWDGSGWTAIALGNDADGATAPVLA